MSARTEDLIAAGHEWSVTNTNSASAAFTCTKSGIALFRHYIRGASISVKGPPTAPFTVQMLSGATVLDEWNFDAQSFLPFVVNFPDVFECAVGQDAILSIPSGIGAIKVSGRISGFTRRQ